MKREDSKLLKVRILNIEELGKNKDKDLVLAIQLSRMANALRTWLRVQLCIGSKEYNIDDLLRFKLRYDITLTHAAVLFECIKNFVKIIDRKLPKFKIDSFEIFRIKELKKRFFFQDEFFELLRHVRDKISFHFDEDVITNTLESIGLNENNLFAIGSSKSKHDLFFSLADDIILNYLSLKRPSHINEIDVFNWFEDCLIKEADEIATLFENIIGDVFHKKLIASEE